MVWPRAVNSGQSQWFQWTYGVVPGGNWGPGHHLFVLDNGDVVSFVSHWTDFQYGETDMGMSLISIVRPDGCERISADASSSALVGSPYDYELMPHSSPLWSGSGDTREFALGTMWEEIFGATDGEDIYIVVADKNIIMKIDVVNRRMTHVAGALFEESLVDSSVGLQARLTPTEHCFVYNGEFYFWNLVMGTSPTHRVLRKMSLAPPYPVSTVRNYAYPAGTNPGWTGTEWVTWGDADRGDGYPNWMNSDVMCPNSSYTPSAVYGDHVYMWVKYSQYQEFIRLDTETWDKEVLYYGIDYSEPLHPIRDFTPNHRTTPNGVLINNFENNRVPGTGTVYYEGMDSGFNNAVIVNDHFITTNDSIASFASGNQVYAAAIIGMHIPTLLDAYESNGNKPIRHDRENPMYKTIANATAGDEVYNFYNYANRRRHFEHNDGYRPTCSHPLWQGAFATGNPGTPWDGKLLYHTSMTAAIFIGDWDNNNGMAVKVLEANRGDGTFRARVSFEGMALKGYSKVSPLTRSAPTEMNLS